MVKLSKRLNKICEFAKGYKRIADVGCDHGKVLGFVAQHFNPEFLIASDISEPSVKKAETLLKKLNLTNFDVRVGNGLQTLTENDNLDLVIIAGMGGHEIVEILKNKQLNCHYVLEPQNNAIKLRRFLHNNNFAIVADTVVYDKGQFYTILKVEKGQQQLSEMQIKYGVFYNKYEADWVGYLKTKKNLIGGRLKNIKNEQSKIKNETNLQEIEQILKEIKIKE